MARVGGINIPDNNIAILCVEKLNEIAYVWLSLLGNDLLSWKNKGCRINIKETVTDKGLKMFEIGRWRYIGDTPLTWCSGGQESFTGNQEYLTTENKKIERRIFGWLEIKNAKISIECDSNYFRPLYWKLH